MPQAVSLWPPECNVLTSRRIILIVLGGSRRFPSSLFPVAKGADFDAEQHSEFCPAKFGRLTQLFDHCSVNAKSSSNSFFFISTPPPALLAAHRFDSYSGCKHAGSTM